MIKQVFRLANLGYIASVGLYYVIALHGRQSFSPEAQHYAEWLSHVPMTRMEAFTTWLGIAALIVSLTAALALIFYYRPARSVYVISFLVMMFCGLFVRNPLLMTATLSFFDSTGSVAAGAIIALAYASPLKDNFSGKQQPR